MNLYEQKQAAKKERLAIAAVAARARATQLHEAGMAALERIPFGQPILVGHHSERRDRNYRARAVNQIDRSFQESEKADQYEQRLERFGSNGISSDDPEAISKLKIKLAKLEDLQTDMKEKNAEARAHKIEQPYAKFQLTNNSALIRDVKKRIEKLEKKQNEEPRPDVIGPGFVLRENKEENRLQFLFDKKPDEAVRSMLKSKGFRWSPFNKAWQRQLTHEARRAAQIFLQ